MGAAVFVGWLALIVSTVATHAATPLAKRVRWALQDPARQWAFWRFATRVTLEPFSEKLWQECFGASSADVRDDLSDYLPTAISKPVFISSEKLPKLPAFELRAATPGEIARVKGEWERAEIGYVRQRHPEFVERYVEQARRTLVRAYDSGEREPRLLATLGLCQVDANDDVGALSALEAAAGARVVRHVSTPSWLGCGNPPCRSSARTSRRRV